MIIFSSYKQTLALIAILSISISFGISHLYFQPQIQELDNISIITQPISETLNASSLKQMDPDLPAYGEYASFSYNLSNVSNIAIRIITIQINLNATTSNPIFGPRLTLYEQSHQRKTIAEVQLHRSGRPNITYYESMYINTLVNPQGIYRVHFIIYGINISGSITGEIMQTLIKK